MSEDSEPAESADCQSGHPQLIRDNSWDNLERPRTCKLSATLKKRSHNHYIPSCMQLGKIDVSVGEVSVNLQEIADLVAEGSGADAVDASSNRDSHLDPHEMASLTTMLKEVRVAMTVASAGAQWQIVRHLHQLIEFDEWLHKCCLQRRAKYNNLFDLRQTFAQSYRSFSPSNLTTKKQMEIILQYYFRCFSGLSGQPEFCSKLVCPLVLDILDLDCKGQRQSLADRYNTQGIELAIAVRDFQPACEDELALSRGDYLAVTYVSVNIDSPTWWEGKVVPREEFETGASCKDHSLCLGSDSVDGRASIQRRGRRRIGFFPSNCVRIVGPGETPAACCRKEQRDQQLEMLQERKVDQELKEQQRKMTVSTETQQQPSSESGRTIRSKYPRLLDSLRAFFRSRPDQSQLIRNGILRNGQFGSDLASYLAENNLEYPPVLTFCISLIESHGSWNEGLYRKSGNGTEVQRLMQIFEYGNHTDDRCTCVMEAPITTLTMHSLPAGPTTPSEAECSADNSIADSAQAPAVLKCEEDEIETGDDEAMASQGRVCPYRAAIHNYTNLLKAYFRELAVPLLAQQFSDCQPEVSQLKDCVIQMSPVHFRVAKFLFSHLHRIASHSDRTLMPSHNLAIVWAPNLCQKVSTSPDSTNIVEAARRSQHQANIVACLIDKCEELFVQPEGVSAAASRVLDVIMPVQPCPSRGFDRSSPFAASIRRNSSSVSAANPAAVADSALLGAAASSAGAKSHRWAKAKAAKQQKQQQQQKQQMPLSLSSTSSVKKLSRRSASDEDEGRSKRAEASTPPPPLPPPQSPPMKSATPNAAEALDLATPAVAVQQAAAAELAAGAAEAADDDYVPKLAVRKAIKPVDSASSVRRTDSNAVPAITVKRAHAEQQQQELDRRQARGDSQISNASSASARRLPQYQQRQKQQQKQ